MSSKKKNRSKKSRKMGKSGMRKDKSKRRADDRVPDGRGGTTSRRQRRFGLLPQRARGIPTWFVLLFIILLVIVILAFIFGEPV